MKKNKVILPAVLTFFVFAAIGTSFYYYQNSMGNSSSSRMSLKGTMLYVDEDLDIVTFGFDKKEEINRENLDFISGNSEFFSSEEGIIILDNENKKIKLAYHDEDLSILYKTWNYPTESSVLKEVDINDEYLSVYDSLNGQIHILDRNSSNWIISQEATNSKLALFNNVLYYSDSTKVIALEISSNEIKRTQDTRANILGIDVFMSGIYLISDFGRNVKNDLILEFSHNLDAVNIHETNLVDVEFIGTSEDASYLSGQASNNYSIRKFQGLPASTQILNKSSEDKSIFSRGKIYNMSDTLSIVDTESLASEQFEISAKVVY